MVLSEKRGDYGEGKAKVDPTMEELTPAVAMCHELRVTGPQKLQGPCGFLLRREIHLPKKLSFVSHFLRLVSASVCPSVGTFF